jgi:hypothetical protein
MSTSSEENAIVPVGKDELAKSGAILDHEFDYESERGTYKVYSISGEPLVVTETYRLAVAENPTGQVGIAMIASSLDSNYAIDKQNRILKTLQQIAADVDNEAVKMKPFYGALFPTALEDFSADDGRLGIFMGYHESIRSYKQLIPLQVALNTVRVDMKSGAWMLGKLMKLLSFIHSLGFTVGLIDDSNVFIEKDVHGIFIMDFTSTNEEPVESEQLEEVAEAAKVIWSAIGGTDDLNADLPFDEAIMSRDDHKAFADLLLEAINGHLSASQMHTKAYALFDQIWPKKSKKDEGGEVLKRDWHEYRTYSR